MKQKQIRGKDNLGKVPDDFKTRELKPFGRKNPMPEQVKATDKEAQRDKELEARGFVSCSCGRVHKFHMEGGRKIVDTGWY